MEQRKYPTVFLSLAVILDVIGLVLFFVGIFAPLNFWDFFVLSGPLLIFISLVFWIFWYLGNLTVPEDELDLLKSNILCPPAEGGKRDGVGAELPSRWTPSAYQREDKEDEEEGRLDRL